MNASDLIRRAIERHAVGDYETHDAGQEVPTVCKVLDDDRCQIIAEVEGGLKSATAICTAMNAYPLLLELADLVGQFIVTDSGPELDFIYEQLQVKHISILDHLAAQEGET